MKNIITLAVVLFTIKVSCFAQSSNAILFTENGEKFQIVLNGVLQNANAETNVKLTDLPANHYKARIIFADTKLGYVDFNMYFNEPGNEVTWNVKKNNKGEYVVRGVSVVPLAQAPPAPATQSVMVYSTTPPAVSTTTTTVHSTQTTGTTGESVNFNMGINDNGAGTNISINASGTDMGMPDSRSSTTTTTTTTVRSTSTSYEEEPVTMYVPGYTGKVGCPRPLTQNEFSDMKQSISSKDFEDSKLTIAKQILKNNCLTASQVKEIITVFEFENTRLDFAKFAYDRTYDVGNYYKVNDAFQFESSIDDLNKYISTK